jgi:predicted RNase H-like nuclease
MTSCSSPVTICVWGSPLESAAYKHREDLIDAVLCAWTAALWHRHGTAQCQVLGDPSARPNAAAIIAPARPDQRR